jgi:hypothetical protein
MENLNEVNASQEPVVAVQAEEVQPEAVVNDVQAEVVEQPKTQTAEENTAFKQMRLKTETLEAKLKKVEEIARLANIVGEDGNGDIDKYYDAAKELYTTNQISELESRGYTSEDAQELIDARIRLKEADEIRAKYQKEQSEKAEFEEFVAYFEKANGRKMNESDVIPKEVWELNAKGTPLKYAYLEIESERVAQQAIKARKDAELAKASPGTVKGIGSTGTGALFTKEEVLAMTTAEVNANYQKVIDSRKSWT